MLFLLIVSVLILIAFLLILPPLWRKQAIQDADLDQRNIRIAQHRLSELKENRRSDGISQAQYEEQLADLEQALSDDLDIKSLCQPGAKPGQVDCLCAGFGYSFCWPGRFT